MKRRPQLCVLVAVSLMVLIIGHTAAADVAVSPTSKEAPVSDHPGQRSLDVEVSSDGEALDNTAVTIINDKTKDQVFSGFTDSAGQVNVTLPQGKYTVVAQGKSKQTNLNKDQTVGFELNGDERPKG